MAGKLTPAGIDRAAALIGCDLPAVDAFLAVETLGHGFLADGRPTILFERHKFWQYSDPAQRDDWARRFPDICNPTAGGYGPGGAAQYAKLYRALQLDSTAAVYACSWGIGQVMGFNWQLAGEASLLGFMMAVHHNEDAQLMLAAQFIVRRGAADELARHDWAGFARLYNGAAYRRNKYDTKLAAAYAAAVRRRRAGG